MAAGNKISLWSLQRLSDLHISTAPDAEKLRSASSLTDDLMQRLIANEKTGEQKPKLSLDKT